MSLLIVLVGLVVVIFLLGGLLASLSGSGGSKAGAPYQHPPLSASEAEQDSELREELAKGSLINAIKRHRLLTGLGLRESKEAVERLRASGGAVTAPRREPLQGELAEVQALVQRGELLAAIKRHRELTGLGLKESKDAVERLRDELPATSVVKSEQTLEQLAAVRQLARGGELISAIKLYREQTGCDLNTARDEVEKLRDAAR